MTTGNTVLQIACMALSTLVVIALTRKPVKDTSQKSSVGEDSLTEVDQFTDADDEVFTFDREGRADRLL